MNHDSFARLKIQEKNHAFLNVQMKHVSKARFSPKALIMKIIATFFSLAKNKKRYYVVICVSGWLKIHVYKYF